MSSTLTHIHDHELPAVSILAHLRWWTNFYLQLQSIVDNFKKVVLLYGTGMFTAIQTYVFCSKRSLMSSCLLTAIHFILIEMYLSH